MGVIVKKLNLNKTPQYTENNSLVFAKNIKVNDDGAYITNEEGYSNVLNSVIPAGYRIVGVIPCNTELVILAYNGTRSKILRCKETTLESSGVLQVTDVPNAWKYNGGDIKGTFTYNYKNELLISFGEYSVNGNTELKVINLDTCKSTDPVGLYSVCPEIPICNAKIVSVVNGGKIPAGIYQFYIRYEITKNNFTRWFPITIPYYAFNHVERTFYKQRWKTLNNEGVSNSNTVYYESTSMKGLSGKINDDQDYQKNIMLRLKFDSTYEYVNYEIAFTLQTDNAVVARRWRTFRFTGQNADITFDYMNVDEISVDELIQPSFNIYNVKAITNYNNRLYIGNYKETEYNVDLQQYANTAKVRYTLTPTTVIDVNGSVEPPGNYNEEDSIELTGNGHTEIIPVADFERQGDYYFIKAIDHIDLIQMFGVNGRPVDVTGGSLIEARYSNLDSSSISDMPVPFHFSDEVFIGADSRTNQTALYGKYNLNWVKLQSLPNVYGFYIYSDDTHKENGSNEEGWFANKIGEIVYFQVGFRIINPDGGEGTTDTEIEKFYESSVCNKRSLIPNQIYSFFIHYVRRDGTYTNGLRISNDNTNTTFVTRPDNTTYDLKKLMKEYSIENINMFKMLGSSSKYALYHLYDFVNNAADGVFGYYENSQGDKLFKAPDVDSYQKIGIKVTDVTFPPGNEYVGYFISYEEVQYNVVSTIRKIGNSQYKNYAKFVSSDIISGIGTYNGAYIKKLFDVTSYEGTDHTLYGFNEAHISRSNYISKDELDTGGREGGVFLDVNKSLAENADCDGLFQLITIIPSIYTNKNKKLIALGGICKKGRDYTENNVGGDFAYPGFTCVDYTFRYRLPIVISTDGAPREFTDAKQDVVSENNLVENFSFNGYFNYNIYAKVFKMEPQPNTFACVGSDESKSIYINRIVEPMNWSDLFELPSEFIERPAKTYVNYNDSIPNMTYFGQFIRRSNVISDESYSNNWRFFEPNQYKVIAENKGDINNIVGLGLYLLVHTEHSLFEFDRTNLLGTTNNNDVQTQIPDAFDIDYKEMFPTEKGFGGLQDRWSYIVTQTGYTWYDKDSKCIYNINEGKLEDLTTSIKKFTNSIKVNQCRFAYDDKNKRNLICFKTVQGTVTLSYSFAVGEFISLHDYQFDKAFSTKTNIYLFSNTNNTALFNNMYNTSWGNYPNEIVIEDNKQCFPYAKQDGIYYSMLDIIDKGTMPYTSRSGETKYYSSRIEDIKSLESISYVLSKLNSYFSVTLNVADENVEMYSGYQLQIYTDSCHTNVRNIRTDGLNNMEDYKVPHNEKGIWNFNYFRDTSLEQYNNLDKTLIYGKYFVCRFMFDNKVRYKFENVQFNVRSY